MMRGIAIISILVCHLLQFVNDKAGIGLSHYIFLTLSRGVELFFILSALSLNESSNFLTKSSLQIYFLKRFFRIYPPYFFAIVITVGIHILLGQRTNLDDLVHSASFTFGISRAFHNHEIIIGSWSLFCELIFYLIFPIIARLHWNRKRLTLLLISSLFIRFFWLYVADRLGISNLNEFRELFPLSKFYAFVIGILIARRDLYFGHLFLFVSTFTGMLTIIFFQRLDISFFILILGFILNVYFYRKLQMHDSKNRFRFLSQIQSILRYFGLRTFTFYLYEFVALDILNILISPIDSRGNFFILSAITIFSLLIYSFSIFHKIETSSISIGKAIRRKYCHEN